MEDMAELRRRVVEAQEVARLVERDFLIARGWEEQGTYDGVTWWSYKGETCSEPQRNAVSLALRGIDERLKT